MASYRGHLAFSSALGAAYGGLASWQWQMDWGPVFLGAGVTALGGLLPDLDSDSSVPFREVFGLAAALTPLVLLQRVLHMGFSTEQTLVIVAGIYLGIRYGARHLFKKMTVHRGMFHSLPAMLIAGLIVFLFYHGSSGNRLFLAGGVMLGFLSHLVLDELYGVDLSGVRLQLKKDAGSALKLISPSRTATVFTYAILVGLGYLVYVDVGGTPNGWDSLRENAGKLISAVRS